MGGAILPGADRPAGVIKYVGLRHLEFDPREQE